MSQKDSFLEKTKKGKKNFYLNIEAAHNEGSLNLSDKKRVCLVTNRFTLDHFKSQHRWVNESDETVMKFQWFHSALSIYILLCTPTKIENSFINDVLNTKTKSTFIAIARDVLMSDPDGVKCIDRINSDEEIILIDDQNKTQVKMAK